MGKADGTLRKYRGLVGYTEGGTPHMWMGDDHGGIGSTDDACGHALEHDLGSFFLIAGTNAHAGYLHNPSKPRGYEKVATREVVLLHLIHPGPYSIVDYHRWKRVLSKHGGWKGVFKVLEEERGDR